MVRQFCLDDGVLKSRRSLVVGDRVDFRHLLAHAFGEGRREIFILDLVEGWIAVLQCAFLGERIGGIEHRRRLGSAGNIDDGSRRGEKQQVG